MTEAWKKVFHEGLVPNWSLAHLETLRDALEKDDKRLIQGATTSPPPLQCMQDWPVESACLLGYPIWQTEEKETVAEVEEGFAKLCFEIDNRLGEPAACRWLLNFFDDTPRDEMRAKLLPEVLRAIQQKQELKPTA